MNINTNKLPTQSDIDNYVANTEEFWNTFHSMLKAPFAFWREYSHSTRQEWIDIAWNSKNILNAINHLKEYPVLKGEGIVCATDEGQVLTNYRYIYTEGGSLINIPLDKMLHYDIVTDSDDRGNDLMIKYLKSGKETILRIDQWIKDEIVAAVRNAGEFNDLNHTQLNILQYSLYDLGKSNITSPQISMLPKSVSDNKGCFD